MIVTGGPQAQGQGWLGHSKNGQTRKWVWSFCNVCNQLLMGANYELFLPQKYDQLSVGVSGVRQYFRCTATLKYGEVPFVLVYGNLA